jgi:hypothetical protein
MILDRRHQRDPLLEPKWARSLIFGWIIANSEISSRTTLSEAVFSMVISG